MIKIEWTQPAKDDLVSIVTYIATDNPIHAQLFKNQIEQQVTLLTVFPEVGRNGRVHGTREFVVSDNYILIYQFLNSNLLKIVRVLHAKKKWP